MPFITQGKTNLIYILIVVVLAVIVGGGILGYYYSWIKDLEAKLAEIETRLPVVETPIDETANWETYKNEEYGFEIKYPPDFIEQKTESANVLLNITKEDRGSLYITIRVIKNYDINDILSSVGEVKEINVGDHLGYEYFYVEGIGTSRVRSIQLGQNALIIEFDYIGDGQIFVTANDKKVYLQAFSNQILSTFRFIDAVGQCSPIDFLGYELVKDATGTEYEFEVDLNNDEENEIVRIYNTISNDFGERIGPNMIKIFTEDADCPKEIFSYTGEGNFVWGTQILNNFFGDGYNAVLIKDTSYAMGCGGTIHLLLLTYKDGKYVTINGPDYGSFGLYKFDGAKGTGNKIIIAETKWENDYCCGCEHKLQFIIYTWDGRKYIKTEAGITENKYLDESIEEVLKKEPSVIDPK